MRRDPLWRAMWTVGLGLAVVVFTGLLLNLIPAGLTRLTWIISLAAMAGAAALVVMWRTRRLAGSAARPQLPVNIHGSRVVVGYIAGAVALAGAAIGLAVASTGWQHSPGLAQLWLVPQHGAVGTHAALGVLNQYRDAESFRLVLLRGTQPIGTWDFRLDAGQSWQRDVSAPVGQRLTARLSTIGQPSGTQSVAVTSS